MTKYNYHKRKSTKRKSVKRKSVKRKSTKCKSTKRKSVKRKSTKRKSTKRKSVKRKSTKRKSVKRKSKKLNKKGGSTRLSRMDYTESYKKKQENKESILCDMHPGQTDLQKLTCNCISRPIDWWTKAKGPGQCAKFCNENPCAVQIWLSGQHKNERARTCDIVYNAMSKMNESEKTDDIKKFLSEYESKKKNCKPVVPSEDELKKKLGDKKNKEKAIFQQRSCDLYNKKMSIIKECDPKQDAKSLKKCKKDKRLAAEQFMMSDFKSKLPEGEKLEEWAAKTLGEPPDGVLGPGCIDKIDEGEGKGDA